VSTMPADMQDRIDALIALSFAWQNYGCCYGCGAPASYRVDLPWMGAGGRLYCLLHGVEWSHAGWPHHVHRLLPVAVEQ
jgi:hypothetical protein